MNNIKCLSCENIVHLKKQADYLVCAICKTKYPLIDGKVPILVNNSTKYLASVFCTLTQYVKSINEKYDDMAQKVTINPIAKSRVLAISHATKNNNKLFEEILLLIDPYFSKKDLFDALNENDSIPYTIGLDYIRRDWCWVNEGEKEIDQMRIALVNIINELEINGNALFMGGGTGRIAYELQAYFQYLTVIDYSLTMSFLFYKLLEEDIVFYDIAKKNVVHNRDIIRPMKASLTPPTKNKSFSTLPKSNLMYYVADAKHIPLPDNSISVYFSIYFTDVIPLSQLIPELKRVLRNKGYFVHLGPLDYHFTETVEMYSGNEIVELFSSQGFKLIKKDSVYTKHCAVGNSLCTKTYNNLIYCFQLEQEFSNKLEEDMILEMNQTYIVKTEVSMGNNVNTEIHFANGEVYEGAELVVLILQEINGENTVLNLLTLFREKVSPSKEEEKKLLDILKGFVKSGILRVMN